MRRRSVFRDKEKLFPFHVPESLPHRGRFMGMLQDLFEDFLEKPGRTYERVVQVFGPVGSGKTCTVHRFGLEFEEEAKARRIPLKFVHISCKQGVDSRFVLYRILLQQAAPEVATRGESESEMLRRLVNYIKREGKFLLLALDDVDYLIRRSKEKVAEGGVVFDLTRLNEMYLGEYPNVIGVIFIARDASFKKLLDPSELSTLGNVVIKMPSYSTEQLKDILKERVDEAFRFGAVEDEIVEFVAELAAGKAYNPGDCRFALDILLTSGLIADAEEADVVSIEHVRKAASESFDGISSEDIMALDEHELLVLIGAVQALKFYKSPYVSIKNVWEYYQIACEGREVSPLSYTQVREYIKDLDSSIRHSYGTSGYSKRRSSRHMGLERYVLLGALSRGGKEDKWNVQRG